MLEEIFLERKKKEAQETSEKFWGSGRRAQREEQKEKEVAAKPLPGAFLVPLIFLFFIPVYIPL